MPTDRRYEYRLCQIEQVPDGDNPPIPDVHDLNAMTGEEDEPGWRVVPGILVNGDTLLLERKNRDDD